jgi:hypothetical protein
MLGTLVLAANTRVGTAKIKIREINKLIVILLFIISSLDIQFMPIYHIIHMRKIKYQARKDLVKSAVFIDENVLHPGITATRTERIMNESVSLYKPRILEKNTKTKPFNYLS